MVYRRERQREPCADGIFPLTKEWHEKYWSSLQDAATTKLRDWEHEDEYRLVLTSTLEAFSDPKDRKLTYQFSDLEGIIFGIKTSSDDKERIFRIISAKCKAEGQRTFEFSQSSYTPLTGKIVTMPLELLRVSEAETAAS